MVEPTDFYRLIRLKSDVNGYNDGLIHGYRGYGSYQSVYNFNTIPFLSTHFADSHFVSVSSNKYIPEVLSGLTLISDETRNSFISDDFGWISTGTRGELYVNEHPIGLGYAVKDSLNESMIKDLPLFEQDWLRQYYVIRGDNQDEHGQTFDHVLAYQQGLNSDIQLDPTNSILVIDYSLDNNESLVTLEYYDTTGQSIAYRTFNEYGYVVDRIPDGATNVYVYASNEFNSNEYVSFYAYQLVDSHVDTSKLTVFDNVTGGQDQWDATIDVDQSGYVVTGLAYDDGWQVSIDGETIDTYLVNQAFLGFDIPSGYHMIHIEYHLSYLTISCGCSIGCLLIAIVMTKSRWFKLFG